MIDEVAAELPGLQDVVFLGSERWDNLAPRRAVDDDALVERAATLSFDDPSTSSTRRGTTGFPRARRSHHNILNNGFFVGGCSTTASGTGCACPCPSTTASGW